VVTSCTSSADCRFFSLDALQTGDRSQIRRRHCRRRAEDVRAIFTRRIDPWMASRVHFAGGNERWSGEHCQPFPRQHPARLAFLVLTGLFISLHHIDSTVAEIIASLEREEASAAAVSQSSAVPRKKRGAQKGPGVVATIALGVEITDEQ